MTLQTAAISDSIKFSAIKTDRFKTGILTFTLTIPLSSKSYAYNTVLTGVLRRGSANFPSLALLNKRLDELYASSIDLRSIKNAENLSLLITAEFLDNRYIPDGTDVMGGVIDVISDLILHPLLKNGTFDSGVVAQEKRVALDYLDSEINNTRLYALKRCYEGMYRFDEDYPSTARQKAHINNVTEKELYEHYLYLLSTASLDVFYVGDEEINTVSAKISSSFEDHFTKNAYIPSAPLNRPVLPLISSVEKMPVSQGKLTLGFRTGACIDKYDKSYYAALVFNELFGASPSSKLFINVREKLSLCYYCSSSYNVYSGDMTVASGVEVKNREVAEREILNQLDTIRHGDISDAEFTAALRSLENSYKQIFDSPLDLQSFYSARIAFGITDTVEDTIKHILAVTRDEVVAIANQTHLDTVFFVEGTATDGGEEDYDDE